MKPSITAFCHIKNNRVYLNGRLVFSPEEEMDRQDFMKAAFRNTGTKYPKFFKMDEYSKLGFLAAEVLMSAVDGSTIEAKSTGIVLSNSQATLVTDQQFQDSIQSDEAFFPSPSIFVYTLPNIMAGEIAIRHHLTGENAFFVSSSFDSAWQTSYVNQLMTSDKITACLSGWIDLSSDHYEAFICYVTRDTKGNSEMHSGEILDSIFRIIDK